MTSVPSMGAHGAEGVEGCRLAEGALQSAIESEAMFAYVCLEAVPRIEDYGRGSVSEWENQEPHKCDLQSDPCARVDMVGEGQSVLSTWRNYALECEYKV